MIQPEWFFGGKKGLAKLQIKAIELEKVAQKRLLKPPLGGSVYRERVSIFPWSELGKGRLRTKGRGGRRKGQKQTGVWLSNDLCRGLIFNSRARGDKYLERTVGGQGGGGSCGRRVKQNNEVLGNPISIKQRGRGDLAVLLAQCALKTRG